MSTTYVFPQLAGLYHALEPWAEALLRVAVGVCLIPHGLRMAFGLFPNAGGPCNSIPSLAAILDKGGWRPGTLWAPIIAATELIGGPLLALGLFTRLAAIPIVILLVLSIVEHWRFGWFWNKQGIEYPVVWAAGAFYFLVHGGGVISLDQLIGWEF